MQASAALAAAMRRFYERRSASDVASFDDVVSREIRLFIGTGPGEWFEDRELMRRGFGMEGLRIEPGDPRGWEEGALGWVADQPTMYLPDGTTIRCRMTAVLRSEDGAWKLAAAHFSVGVPDDEVEALQARWRSGTD